MAREIEMGSTNRAFYTAPDSLKIFEAPKKDCMITERMKEIHQTMQEGQNKVMHIHGMPGSGKSQIVAAICHQMADNGHIVWHVQCQPYKENVANCWKNLCYRLEKAKLISPNDFNMMLDALEVPSSSGLSHFLKVIGGTTFPVFLAVEFDDVDDVTSMQDDLRILRRLIDVFSPDYRVQLLIASRNEDILFPTSDVQHCLLRKRREVHGFNVNEAREFLACTDIDYSEEKISALAKELAYSPLGLLMAKNYCREFHVSYDDYYKSLGNDDSITKKEKDLLKKYPDLGKNHRYEIIMKLLKPNGTDPDEDMEFQVMKMIAFLNNNNIPRQILKSFFRQLKLMKSNEINILTKHLIRKLEKRVGCTRGETGENGSINLNGDVLRVLRASMSADEKAKVLASVLFNLLSILDKDNRLRKDYGFLYALKNHMIHVSAHCSHHFQRLEDEAAPTELQYEIILSLSRIHELVGFVISQHPGMRESNEEDRHFEKAMEYLWAAVTMQTDKSVIKTLADRLRGITAKNKKSLFAYEFNTDPKKAASEVYKVCEHRTRSNKALLQALKNDYRRNFPVKLSDLHIMKKLDDKKAIKWDSLENELEENGVLSEPTCENLVKAKFLLDWNDLSQFYIVERMASILHSRGRQDNYKRELLNDEMIEKCSWWVEFGCELCVKVTKQSGFYTMFDYMLRANNALHKLSINRKDESDADFRTRIDQVREMATVLQKEDRIYYEHGKIRIVSNTPYTILNASKYLVKVNTKVHKRQDLLQDYPFAEADKEADETFNMAVSNPTIVLGMTCLVHVGKYFAARKNFPRAMEAFEKAFQLGIEKDVNNNATRFAWALYNMLRALKAAGEDYYDERTKRNIELRYNMTQTNGTPNDWTNRLTDIRANAPTSDAPINMVQRNAGDVANNPSGDITP